MSEKAKQVRAKRVDPRFKPRSYRADPEAHEAMGILAKGEYDEKLKHKDGAGGLIRVAVSEFLIKNLGKNWKSKLNIKDGNNE